MTCLRMQAKGHFAEQQPLLRDLGGEIGIFGGVDAIKPACQHRDGAAVHAGVMGQRVDPARQPRGDDIARRPQIGGQPPRHPRPQRRGIARADHRHHGARHQRDTPLGPKDRRRIGDIGQCGGVCGIAQAQHPCAGALGGLDLGQGHGFGAGGVAVHACRLRNRGQGAQRLLRAAMRIHQPQVGCRPHAPRTDQAQSRDLIRLIGDRGRHEDGGGFVKSERDLVWHGAMPSREMVNAPLPPRHRCARITRQSRPRSARRSSASAGPRPRAPIGPPCRNCPSRGPAPCHCRWRGSVAARWRHPRSASRL